LLYFFYVEISKLNYEYLDSRIVSFAPCAWSAELHGYCESQKGYVQSLFFETRVVFLWAFHIGLSRSTFLVPLLVYGFKKSPDQSFLA
jgi:hypothetical protein